jgi:exopolysaccharide biosynthesis polyprenyl glycosylphosphotransferase
LPLGRTGPLHNSTSAQDGLGDTTLSSRVQIGPVLRLPEAQASGNGHVAGVGPSQKRILARRYRTITLVLLGADVLCLAASLLGPSLLLNRPLQSGSYLPALGAAVPLWWATFAALGLYRPWRFSVSEEYRRTVTAVGTALILVAATTTWWGPSFSAASLLPRWLSALLLELALRRGCSGYVSRLRATGRLALPTLVLGTNGEAGKLAKALAHPGSGFRPLGYVECSRSFISPDGLPVLGGVGNLRATIRKHGAECLFVASSDASVEEVARAATVARLEGIEVRVSTVLPDVLASRVAPFRVGPRLMLSLRPARLTRAQRALKRAFDVALSGILLALTLPLWVLIAAAIRLTSPGPVVFRQERVTKGMRTFTLYKFRTMATPMDGRGDEEPEARSVAFFKLREDPSVTRVGRVLRRFSLDELPQLLNVIRGDMSLVGPRPLPVDQVRRNLQLLMPRHEVRPGMTGWWQINGRSAVDGHESVRLDMFYIENQSLTLDLYILWKTLGAVASGAGAY